MAAFWACQTSTEDGGRSLECFRSPHVTHFRSATVFRDVLVYSWNAARKIYAFHERLRIYHFCTQFILYIWTCDGATHRILPCYIQTHTYAHFQTVFSLCTYLNIFFWLNHTRILFPIWDVCMATSRALSKLKSVMTQFNFLSSCACQTAKYFSRSFSLLLFLVEHLIFFVRYAKCSVIF